LQPAILSPGARKRKRQFLENSQDSVLKPLESGKGFW